MNQNGKSPGTEDLTGIDRMYWNTIVSWCSQIVVIITGFLLPRLMHETLGQNILGIWDFGWTFVNYFGVMNIGVGSSANRYIARYRAAGRLNRVNAIVTTVSAVQAAVCVLILLMLYPLYLFLETNYVEELGENLASAQWVLTFLLGGLAIEMLMNPARGVITGYHRWDIHSTINAGSSVICATAMILVLLNGGDILDVSVAYFCAIATAEVCRLMIAIRVAPEVRLKISYISFYDAKELVLFGAKSFIIFTPPMILSQTVNLLTVAHLGPAALAVYARPFALIRHLMTMVTRFTNILSPTVGSLQTTGDGARLAQFFINTLRFNFSLTLPCIAFFVLFGDLIVQLWMGSDYKDAALISTLALGYLMVIGQDGVIRILQGLNKHGFLGKYMLVSIVLTAILTYLFLSQFTWTLMSSALLLTIPLSLTYSTIAPIYACKVIGISWLSYLGKVIFLPVLYNVPFISGLVLTRYLVSNEQIFGGVIVFSVSCFFELIVYFTYLLPVEQKEKLKSLLWKA